MASHFDKTFSTFRRLKHTIGDVLRATQALCILRHHVLLKFKYGQKCICVQIHGGNFELQDVMWDSLSGISSFEVRINGFGEGHSNGQGILGCQGHRAGTARCPWERDRHGDEGQLTQVQIRLLEAQTPKLTSASGRSQPCNNPSLCFFAILGLCLTQLVIRMLKIRMLCYLLNKQN